MMHIRWTATAALALLTTAAPAFDLEGHRGARGLAPENTIAAFKRALAIGVTTIETDLAVTRDDVLVISHDPFLNPDIARGPDGQWLTARGPAIRTLSLSELKRYDIGRLNPASRYAAQFPEQKSIDGERFPTLYELLALVKAHDPTTRLNIETKITPLDPAQTVDPAAFAKLVVDAVRARSMADRVTVQSFDWRTLVEVKKLAPEIPLACLTIQTENDDNVKPSAEGPSPWTAGLDLRRYDESLPRLVQAAGCAIWSPLARNATPARIAESHALGLKVLPWTVNDPAEMARLIDAGVDGIITDYPDRVRRVMAEKKLALP